MSLARRGQAELIWRSQLQSVMSLTMDLSGIYIIPICHADDIIVDSADLPLCN